MFKEGLIYAVQETYSLTEPFILATGSDYIIDICISNGENHLVELLQHILRFKDPR